MKYWKRHIEFIIGTKTFAPPFALEFETDFKTAGSSQSKAYIYNPSDETIASVEPAGKIKKTIIINAGYEEDYGLCVSGEINSFSVKDRETSRVLELNVGDATDKWSNSRISRTWPPGIGAQQVIMDLVSSFGLGAGNIMPGKIVTYPNGISFNTKLRRALQQMARETDSEFFLRNGRLHFQPKKSPGIVTGFILSPATGLIGMPEKTDIGWKLQSLFNYHLGAGDSIQLLSKKYSGVLKIIQGKHKYTESTAYTEIEAKIL